MVKKLKAEEEEGNIFQKCRREGISFIAQEMLDAARQVVIYAELLKEWPENIKAGTTAMKRAEDTLILLNILKEKVDKKKINVTKTKRKQVRGIMKVGNELTEVGLGFDHKGGMHVFGIAPNGKIEEIKKRNKCKKDESKSRTKCRCNNCN